jgi:inositol hexakisphosphate/diphosphoinositol-pentakisphosphate kinase
MERGDGSDRDRGGGNSTKCFHDDLVLPGEEDDLSNRVESEGDDDDDDEQRKILVGICARDKKTKAKPMQSILKRFPADQFEIVMFDDKMVDTMAIEEWPIVDCLISFFSSGFNLEKTQEYISLRKPWTCNDLNTEHVLRDRRSVYDHLKRNNIPVPTHVFCNRDGYEGNEEEPVVVEYDDYIEGEFVNGEW